jgi:hypothetical protein
MKSKTSSSSGRRIRESGLRDMFADMRMLAYETGLMNALSRLLWRICEIDGKPSRYRSELQRPRA